MLFISTELVRIGALIDWLPFEFSMRTLFSLNFSDDLKKIMALRFILINPCTFSKKETLLIATLVQFFLEIL